jgi:adenylosuccinate synthase
MIEKVVLLSGPISSGKSTLAQGLADQFGMDIFRTREVLQARVAKELVGNRKILQSSGEKLDRATKGTWVREEITKRLYNHPEITTIVVDSVRISNQIDAIRESFGSKVIHVHLTAPQKELEKRYKRRQKSKRESTRTYAEAHDDPTEKQVETLSEIADVVIDTKRCTDKDVLVRVSSHLNIRRGKGRGYVDVLIGGQYGSEGKGHIAAYLAQEYDLLVRVGGPNAGHKVYEEPDPYTHHQLPSGTRRNEEAHLLIGPGATLRVDKLLDEIADCKVNADRLSIDPKVMIISDADKDSEVEGVKTIGSTGQGVGAAMARRIQGRFDIPPPIMARDIPQLRPYLANTLEVLEQAYAMDNRVLLEGTQGTELSLYHGSYPHVTSRDTTVAGCLSEAGIAWNRIRKVIMICRTYPIRVQNPEKGTSGPMSQEINWPEVSRRSQISKDALEKSELTSTTHKQRRVSEFDWNLLHKSSLLNGATDIALTFTDYLSKKNQEAKRFEQLHSETINFIQEVERVSGARVSLISTGFNYRSIIDRRSW